MIGSEADNPVHVTVSPTPDAGLVMLYSAASVGTSELLGADGTVDIGHRGGGWLRACYIGTLQFQSACAPIQIVDSITYPVTVSLAISPASVYVRQAGADVFLVPAGQNARDRGVRRAGSHHPVDNIGQALHALTLPRA